MSSRVTWMRPRGQRPPRASAEAGLTLIELMVSLVITSLAVAAAFGMAYAMMNSYRDHQRSMEVEQAARASLELIGNSIRSASPGVPTGKVADLAACSGETNAIAVANDLSGNGPDALGLIYGSGGVVTSVQSTYDCTGGSCPGTMQVYDASYFQADDYLVVTNFDQGYFLKVTGVDTTTNTLQIASSCSIPSASDLVSFDPGALVIRSRLAVFYVDATTYAYPTLVLDPDGPLGSLPAEPVAEGIEDFQVAVAIDDDGDDTIEEADPPTNTDEVYFNVSGDSYPPDLSTATEKWRAIRITVVARSTREFAKADTSIRPGAEDHAAASAADRYKRRTMTTTIELRNLEGSP